MDKVIYAILTSIGLPEQFSGIVTAIFITALTSYIIYKSISLALRKKTEKERAKGNDE